MATTKITNFVKGFATDLRSQQGFGLIQGFRTYPHKLVPQFNTKADEVKALGITRFQYAPWLSTTSFALFGYGVVVDTARPAVYIKGNISGDIIGGNWGTPASGTDATDGARDTRVFFYYKGYFYGFAGGASLWRWGKIDDLSGISWTNTYQSINYTNLADPLHHPADDCAYFFVDNKVYRLNGTTWDGLVLTLPDNMIIVSADADGDYIQIGCKSNSGLGNSWTFQWDRDSSLSTITGKADWGRGNLVHIANLQGITFGVIDKFTLSSFGHNSGKIAVKALVNGAAKTIGEYDSGGICIFSGNKFVTDDKLHFPFDLSRDGSYIHGIFSVDAFGQLRVEISEPETDSGTAGLRYQGIYKTGEYWWIAHSNDGSVNRTNDQTVYGTGILETGIISGGNQQVLIGATVSCEPLPEGGSIVLKYRKVGTKSWTTMNPTKTIAAGDTTIHFTTDVNGKAPRGDELQYRIESTGGAVIVASDDVPIVFEHEVDDQKPYG